MPRERDYALLHAAAYHFANFSRKAAEIAESVGVADRTIRQFARDPNGTAPSMFSDTPA